jgi:CBS-domain-containing membrane protein
MVGGLLLAIGGLGWLLGQPWLFASLGPTAYLLAHSPSQPSAHAYNIIAGHLIAVCAAFAAVAALGAGDAPPVFTTHELVGSRVLASGLALIVAVGVELLMNASHPPAAATVLLITLGGFPLSLHSATTIIIGVLLIVLIGEPLRRLRTASS